MADETRLQAIGGELLALAQAHQKEHRGDQWLNEVFERAMANPDFRLRAMRFVDVLPALEDDAVLVRHLHGYFDEGELPLPGIARWGLQLAGGLAPRMLAAAVRRGAGLMARRFLGGADIGEALETVDRLHQTGMGVSLDHLGEAVVSEAEAAAYLGRVLDAVQRLGEHARLRQWDPRADAVSAGPLNLSVKLSSLYSQASAHDLNNSVGAILDRLRPLARAARREGISLCLDMEHYDLKPVVLEVFRRLAEDSEFVDWAGMAVALQAYLQDADADIARLAEWTANRPAPVTVRLVRGAYWDQETILAGLRGWASPVWPDKNRTDACFERCLHSLFDSGGTLRPAVATHNVRSLALALVLAEERGLGEGDFELQMLHGMGAALHSAVVEYGVPLRIYLPFGKLLPGMAYLVRRLLENSSSQSFLRLGQVPKTGGQELLRPPEASEAIPQPARHPAFRNEPVRRFTDAAERRGFADALTRVRKELGRDSPLIIGGREIETGQTIASMNPARNSELIGRVSKASREQADAAVAAATSALPEWRARTAEQRSALLRRTASLLRGRRDEFAAWAILEAGKPWTEADADVCEAIDFLEYYANQAERLGVGREVNLPGETNRYHYRSRGVGLVLPPWNFPLAILTGLLSATLVTGNTAILKPSSQTPVIAARLVDLLREAGCPDGVVNYLPGSGADVGEYLVRHAGVHLIAFTGSLEVGTRINRLAAELGTDQHHLKRVIAEMGGKNAIIVDADADLDDAVRGVVGSAFGYAGQKCSACSRVILVGDVYRRFLPRLLDAVRSIPIGPPEAPGTLLGPVIEAAARERIEHTITAAAKHTTLALRGESSLEEGWFVPPAVFTDVDPGSPLAQEEIFGPVLAVIEAGDFDRALEIANATRYALTGGVYSREPVHLERAAEQFQVGNLYLNRNITGALVHRQPFGGFSLSGIGSKAGGPDYLLQFMEPRVVTENTLRRGYAPQVD